MKEYQYKDETIPLEDKDFLLITAIDNLVAKIEQVRMTRGR